MSPAGGRAETLPTGVSARQARRRLTPPRFRRHGLPVLGGIGILMLACSVQGTPEVAPLPATTPTPSAPIPLAPTPSPPAGVIRETLPDRPTSSGAPAGSWQVLVGDVNARDRGAPGQFQSPRGLALDAGGNLYVADSGNHRIQRFSPRGELLASWGERGRGAGQFERPTGLAVDGDGNLYVADSGNHRVQKLSPAGEPLATWGGEGTGPGRLRGPEGVALDPAGRLVVADTQNHRVQWFSETGPPRTWGSLGRGGANLNRPVSLAIDPRGEIAIADSGNQRVILLSAIGDPLLEPTAQGGLLQARVLPATPGDPRAVALDQAANLYLVDAATHSIQMFSPNGQPLARWGVLGAGPGQFRSPSGVAVAPDGTIYVADTANHRIQHLTRS